MPWSTHLSRIDFHTLASKRHPQYPLQMQIFESAKNGCDWHALSLVSSIVPCNIWVMHPCILLECSHHLYKVDSKTDAMPKVVKYSQVINKCTLIFSVLACSARLWIDYLVLESMILGWYYKGIKRPNVRKISGTNRGNFFVNKGLLSYLQDLLGCSASEVLRAFGAFLGVTWSPIWIG